MSSRPERFSKPSADASASDVDAGASSSLTYEPFYGLREKPFSLSADPRFLFKSPTHGRAFEELQAGIRRREGLIVLTGEIGTGKTTLCRSVLQHLDRRTFAAFVADPFVSREDLLKTLLVDFGVISIGDLTRGRFNGASRSDLSYPLYEFLDSLVPLQAFAVLVIDEAQNLSLPLLDEIRILSELERREKLLQVVLVGQPELRANLKLPQMRQVDQRVSVRCELKALNADGVAGYVNQRLHVAGRGEQAVDFTSAALEAVHQASSGVPRLINRICDRALQHAYLSRSRRIEAYFVWAALDDLGLHSAVPVEEPAELETPSSATQQPSITEDAAPAPTPDPVTTTTAPSDMAFGDELDLAGLPDVGADDDNSASTVEPIERPAAGNRWIAWAVVSVLAATAVGAIAWYGRAHAVEGPALVPPGPALVATSTAAPVPDVGAGLPQTSQHEAGHRSSEAPASTSATASLKPDASAAGPGARGSYTILVASFKSPESGQRVVEELTNDLFRAWCLERVWV
jgi:general secretion pathway protein A